MSTRKTTFSTVHPEWGPIDKIRILGRTLDLKSAYKNLFNNEESLWAAIVATWCPASGTVELRESFALMFGSTASVFFFNRVAKAIQFLATKALSLVAA